MLKANPPITKDFILQYIRQEDIMEFYIGVSILDSGFFCAPSWMRSDKNPTCNYSWNHGVLYFRDWSYDEPLDCFSVVQKKYNVNFYDALNIIATDFKLTNSVEVSKKTKINLDYKSKGKNNNKSIIRVKIQPFTLTDNNYLSSYHITKEICKKYNVFSPKYVWLDGQLVYVYRKENPALAYYFGKDDDGNEKWKIYYYKKDNYRFIANTNRINGWVQLPKKDSHLIITKSLKDVMCLDIYGISSISMQAESQTPYDYIIEELKNRFNKIISIFDHDEAGKRRAIEIYNKYDIPYYYIIDDNAKDFSDYIQQYGIEKAGLKINNVLNERNM